MMERFTKITLPLLGALFLFLAGPKHLQASHAMGIDILYTHISGNTYQFTVNFYRDCDGIAAPGSVTLQYRSQTCLDSGTIALSLVGGGGLEVSPLCPAELPQSSCNGGSRPGVEQYIYQGTVTFAQSCPDYIVSWTHCCRNNAITNLQSPNSQSTYVEVTLNNTGGLNNSSPVFTSLPVPYICQGQQFCYNHGAIDPDGDSLVYTLIDARTGAGANIPYNTGLNATYPIDDTSGTIFFDSLSGSMCVVPNGIQTAVVVVQVDEYRNGTVIGTTMRDLQIRVLNCTNIQPSQGSAGLINVTGGAQIDSNSVQICPGSTLDFDIQFTDPNLGDTITVTTNITTLIPAGTWDTTGVNPVVGNFSWTPTGADIGFYSFTVTVQDNGCPILGAQVFNYDITVLEGTSTGPDLNYCPAGGPVQLNASGGTNFTWSDIGGGGPTGLSCSNCSNPTASPVATQTYVVTSNLPGAFCQNTDTVTVTVVPDITVNMGGTVNICLNESDTINTTPNPGAEAPFTYAWTPATGLSATNIEDPITTATTNTRYYTTITSAAGCTITDSVDVNIVGVGPLVSVNPVDTICVSETVQLVPTVNMPCGTTTTPCSGAVSTDTIGTSATASQIPGPHFLNAGTPHSQKKQYIFTAAELTAMGFTGGRINTVSLEYAQANDQVTGIEIYMGCVSRDSWTAPSDSFETGLSLVKTSFSHTPVIGFNDFALDFPYNWDGVSNIVIEFCVNGSQTGNGSDVRYTTTTAGRTLYNHLANASGACSQDTGLVVTTRPNMRFNYCEALPAALTYSWSPGTSLDNSAIASPNATPTSTTTYSLTVNDLTCNGVGFVTVNAGANFTIDLGNDTTLCRNSSLLLNAVVPGSGAPYIYNWDQGSATLSDSTVQSPVATPTASTQYRLSATNSGGCEVQDSILVTISGIAPNVSVLDDTICPNGGSATLTPAVSLGCDTLTLACTGVLATDTIADSTTTDPQIHPYFLLPAQFYSNKRQYIFTAAELTAAGITPGTIRSLGFEVTSAGDALTSVVISMGCTNESEFTGAGPLYPYITGLTTVKNSFTLTPAAGWTSITLDFPYNWDGTSNLVIQFCTDQAQFGNATSATYTDLGINRSCYTDNFFANNACSVVTGTRSTFRPNMTFSHCEAIPTYTYSWSPGTGLSSVNTATTTATPTASTTYTLSVDDGAGCISTDFVTVSIDSSAYVDATADTSNLCPNDTVVLGAAITGTAAVLPLPSCGVNGTTCTQPTTTAIVGAGPLSSVSYSPFYGVFPDHRVQYLITAAELTAAGHTSGTIQVIGWNVTSKGSSQPFEEFTIRLGCTNSTTLDTTAGFLGGLTTVYGPVATATNIGTNLFAITPYDWDGTSNIVIDVCYDNQDGISVGSDQVQYTSGLAQHSTMDQGSTTPGDNGCNLSNPNNLYTIRPNITLGICPPTPQPFTYSWSPTTGLSNPTASNPIAEGAEGITYTVTVSGGNCTITDSISVGNCFTLPADLLTFTGNRALGGIQLDWTTASEKNLDRFVLERHPEGGSFARLTDVPAMGNSNSIQLYDHLDSNPYIGWNYYRLRMVDRDGHTEYSNVVRVLWSETNSLISVYPNPVNSGQSFFLDYFSEGEMEITVEVVDMMGRRLITRDFNLQQGANTLEYPAGNLPAGSYFVRVIANEDVQVRKFQIIE